MDLIQGWYGRLRVRHEFRIVTASMSCVSSQPPRDFSSFPGTVLLPHFFPASFDLLVIRSSLIAQLGFICSFDTLESRCIIPNGPRSIHSQSLYGQVFSAELPIIMYLVTFSTENNQRGQWGYLAILHSRSSRQSSR